ILQPRNHPKHALLLTPLQARLAGDQGIESLFPVLRPELQRRMRSATRSGIDQSDRFEVPKRQGPSSFLCDCLDWGAAREVFDLFQKSPLSSFRVATI